MPFLAIFFIPWIACIIYFGFLESDIYVSESMFVVRQPERRSVSSLSVLLSNFGVSSVREESYVVKSFALSRDSLRDIEDNLHLAKAYGSRNVDFVNRFDPLGFDDSFEALYKYLSEYITVDIDTASSIATLRVKAFSPSIAYSINEGLLFMSEGLINKLNDRARKDMLDNALQEVHDAEEDARKYALALSAYQDKETLFDPGQQSTMQLQQVARLQTELIAARGQLAQYREFASESPQIRALEKRISELRKEIDIEMSKVTGGTESITQKLIEFERRKLDSEFSRQRLGSALAALEQARAEVQRQQLYLERIAQPSTPDEAIYPRRFLNTLAATGVLLIIYAVIKMLVLGVLEHKE